MANAPDETADAKPASNAETAPSRYQEMVGALAKQLDENGLTEIEVEQGGLRVRVARHGQPIAAATALGVVPVAGLASVAPRPAEAAAHPGLVTSPMVGSAYRSAAPGAKPFVDVGSKVQPGDTLLVIEAMKTMNQIPAPRGGTVTQILFENAQPVEYGEPLMIIE